MHRWNKFHQYLLDTYKHIPDPKRGFAPDEIEQVRIAQQVDYLPPIYIEFLRSVGKVYTMLSRGLVDHKKNALYYFESIPELGLEPLPPDAFYFLSDLDDVFLYFRTDNRDPNPTVFKVGEESSAVVHKQYYDNLVSYLITQFGVQDMFT